MTDSIAHNLGVIEDVCEELGIEDVPDSLVCHVHPLMMLQRKVMEFGRKSMMLSEQIQ